MNIHMSGATGFIGSHLSRTFADRGWKVIPLRREDLKLGDDDFLKKMEAADVVVNLAGASVAERWTEEYKKVMYSSRVDTTRKIVNALGKMVRKPGLFISTSAVGIYDTEGEHTEEDAHYANDFLGKLALDWERAALKAGELGVRTVIFRFGVVLGIEGGALKKMLIPFRMGLGGVIGHGKQPFSWVHIEDLIRAYTTVIENDTYHGIYNLTSPYPITNADLTKALGHALHKPAFVHVPAFAFRLQLGEGARVLLEGQRVLPRRLLESGFTFKFTEIETALEDLVGKEK
ncbi:MAG TPA: TIGR01777 family oxidoreductase [Thermodesulfovibrionales bacterium]|nr:TIGR01777 family oxidoreductase [Thermodesulfovibrionales bacterium]